MRNLTIGVSIFFFAASLLVTGAALRAPAPVLDLPSQGFGHVLPPDDSSVLEEVLNRLADDQAASQKLVAELQSTIGALKKELTDKQKEALSSLAREQASSQSSVAELHSTIAGLEEKLLSAQRETLSRISREQAANLTVVANLEETITDLRREVSGKSEREAPAPAVSAAPPSARPVSEPVDILEEPSSSTAKVPPEETLIATLGGGLFRSGQGVLTPELEQAVAGIFPDLKAGPDDVIILEGHTDSSPIGPSLLEKVPDNRRLSLFRAEAIAQVLVEKGIPRSRIMVSGFGGSRPIATNHTPEGRASNRRVEIKLAPAVKKDN